MSQFTFLAIKADSHQVEIWHPFCWVTIRIIMILGHLLIQPQVGPGDDYTLMVGGFNDALSTLGDSMSPDNGQKFSTR